MNAELFNTGIVVPLLSAFAAGFLTSLTPCVYPLIPITIAVFGARGAESRWKSFSLAVTYVLGITFTYTVLGVLSARTGVLFGSALGSPYLVFPLVALFVFLGLYTLGVVQFTAVSRLQTIANKYGGKGYLGAFTMGVVSGGVAAPCVGPSLLAILTVAAHSQNTVWAASLLCAYSLGLGVLFIVLGTFAGALDKLPRSGAWLNGVKFIIGSAIFGISIFLLQPFYKIPITSADLLLLGGIGAIGLVLGAIGLRRDIKIATVIGAVLLAVAVYQSFVPPPAPQAGESVPGSLVWNKTLEASLAVAQAKNQIVMVDLYADWCAACKEYELYTFPDPKVKELLGQLVLTKIDLTKFSADNREVRERYKILGLPAILFLRSSGEELADTRATGFMAPEEFVKHLKMVLAK